MSMFQIRSGGSSFKTRDEEGIKKIITFIKLNKGGNRYMNNPRFEIVKISYNSLVGSFVEAPSDEIRPPSLVGESNRMYVSYEVKR